MVNQSSTLRIKGEEVETYEAVIAAFFVTERQWRGSSLVMLPHTDPLTGLPFHCPLFATDPLAFDLVEREIARRNWEWRSTYHIHPKPRHVFEVRLNPEDWTPWEKGNIFAAEADWKELAGCIALNAVLEHLRA